MTTANSNDYKLLTILKKTLTYDQPHNLRQVLNMKTNYTQLQSSHLITLSLTPMTLNLGGHKNVHHQAPKNGTTFSKNYYAPLSPLTCLSAD